MKIKSKESVNADGRPAEVAEILRDVPLFKPLSRSQRRRLAEVATIERFRKGDIVVREKDPCRMVHVVLSGRLRMSHSVTDSRLPEISRLGAGAVIGRREILHGDPHRATVEASVAAEILSVPAADLLVLLHENSRFLKSFSPKLPAPDAGGSASGERGGRIAALASLHPGGLRLDLQAMATQVHSCSGEGVLLLEIDDAVASASGVAQAVADDKLLFGPAVEPLPGNGQRLTLRAGAATDGDWAALFNRLNEKFTYVVVAVHSVDEPGVLPAVIRQSDVAFLYLEPNENEVYDAARLVAECGDAAGMNRLFPVLVFENSETSCPLDTLSGRIGIPVYATLCRDCGAGATEHHCRLIARTIGRRRVGLALSSGSAKGLAHIGVIQVLEEAGIEIDIVAGTSMGAYVGACWCAGNDGAHLQKLAEQVAGRRGLFALVDPMIPPRRGFVGGRKAKQRLQETLGNQEFAHLGRPLHVVATDLETLRMKVFSSGSVVDAVHASMAMPGICVPAEVGGRLYTDGAACSPLPVGVLEHLGIERIIAVSTLPTLDDLEAQILTTGVTESPSIWRRFLRLINRHVNYFAKGNVLDTLMRGLQSSQTRITEFAARRADVFIQVYPSGARWYEFDQHAKYIAAGRKAALAQLDAVKRLCANANSTRTLAA